MLKKSRTRQLIRQLIPRARRNFQQFFSSEKNAIWWNQNIFHIRANFSFFCLEKNLFQKVWFWLLFFLKEKRRVQVLMFFWFYLFFFVEHSWLLCGKKMRPLPTRKISPLSCQDTSSCAAYASMHSFTPPWSCAAGRGNSSTAGAIWISHFLDHCANS